MESDAPVRQSVAELTGMFKGVSLSTPTEQSRPARRKPPRSLPLPSKTDNDGDSDKPTASPHPPKVKAKNFQLIEKLQANLALSPTALLPSPKSPEVKLQPGPASPPSPNTLRPPRLSSEDEEPLSFERPAEGTPLPSINKSRARLSFKRRPPTRQHRRSAGEEAGASGGDTTPSEPPSPLQNGDDDPVFEETAQEGGQRDSCHQPDAGREAENRDEEEEEAEDKAPAGCEEDIDQTDPALGEQAQASDPLETIREEGHVGSCPAEGSAETEEQDVVIQMVDGEQATEKDKPLNTEG